VNNVELESLFDINVNDFIMQEMLFKRLKKQLMF
jgi:hypothetical protein